MDSGFGVSLSSLYKNDPFYSLCLSDLMTAPQRVTYQFLKEQRNLTESLKRIDHCQISRIKELNEEKKQFSLLMKRRLAQGTVRQSSLGRDRESRHSCSTRHFSDLSSVKSSTQSFDTLSSASVYSTERPASFVFSSTVCYDGASRMRESQQFFVTLMPADRCYQRPKLLAKSARCFSALRSENIGKTISQAAYRVK
ncbi:uncharacterized protein LOC143939984 [Lithobates pipiens]